MNMVRKLVAVMLIGVALAVVGPTFYAEQQETQAQIDRRAGPMSGFAIEPPFVAHLAVAKMGVAEGASVIVLLLTGLLGMLGANEKARRTPV